ncbi:MAG: hypothetical protein LH617_14170 [Ramlibacter sp.]|nr:hypothetical protein [Ramlibacter sp.]
MTRLQDELQRLSLSDAARQPANGPSRPDPMRGGQVRAMVLELAGATAWDELARVWQGVQADLHLPAPGIAVSGIDGLQLWFSLQEPVSAAQAAAFLQSLRERYLGEVMPERIRTNIQSGFGSGQENADPGELQPPPIEVAPGRWSAFVAPDLAAVFGEEPWLDLPPSPAAQADLLSRLQSMKPADWRRAVERLASAGAIGADPAGGMMVAAPISQSNQIGARATPAGGQQDPRRFLLEVMNDPTIELNLRIEAAKALLPCVEGRLDV